jgi:hypothetical protein
MSTTPKEWRATDRAVHDYLEKCADRTEPRLEGEARRAKGFRVGAPKKPWDRRQFVFGLVAIDPDHPVSETADLFEEALRVARGNPKRFRQELDRLLR